MKLLAALRSGDPALIHPFLAEIGRSKKDTEGNETPIDLAATTLHLAIRCASCKSFVLCLVPLSTKISGLIYIDDTILFLLSNRSISPNAVHPPGSKTTALHLAAGLNRADVVKLLLEQDDIDCSARDSGGRTASQLGGKEVKDVIQGTTSKISLGNPY